MGASFRKLSHLFNLVCFKIGELFFPILEPFFRVLENRDAKVKKHFIMAANSFRGKKTAIALLNLNMVLSLKPKHFLALVYRGRIYSLEGQYNLASKDFLQANKINQYRFTHYGLYREYIKTVNHEVGSLGNSITRNFNQVFEVLRKVQDKTAPETDGDDRLDNLEMLGSIESEESDLEGEDIYLVDELGFERKDEREKFRRLGPITQKEIDDINWNHLIKKLSS